MLFEALSIPRYRLVGLAALFLAATLTLLVRLWQLQVSEGSDYATKQHDRTTVSIRLSPARGAILDRNGVALAENRASFDIDFYLDELVRNYAREHHGRKPLVKVPHVVNGKTYIHDEIDIVKIVSTDLELISKSLGFEIKLDANALRRHYAQNATIPFQYRSDVDFDTLAEFSERNLGVPGIQIAVRPVRYYNYGALASHLLGYIGQPDDNSQTAEDGRVLETVGRVGLEKAFDDQLQGQPGRRSLQIDYRGYIQKEEQYVPPAVGSSLYLTLDANVQYIVEQVLRRAGRGAAIVMDPSNGDILAMASVPSFDPNDFVPRISSEKWKAIYEDETHPLTNRALGAYPPGSTFKVLISMAGLKSGRMTPTTSLFCPAVLYVDGHAFHDDVTYDRGNVILHDGLRVSCDTYFYQFGIKTGIDNIDQMAQLAGFGQSTGFPLPEAIGTIPGPAWMKENMPQQRWTDAYTALTSIGQGDVRTTPLQLATFMCAVANGGTLYYPRLIVGMTDGDGKIVSSTATRKRSDLGVSPSDMAAIKQGLREVVENGTATSVQLPYVKVAGKTGTAQFYGRVHGKKVADLRTWFYCFAPAENPRYVVLAFVEGGVSGGSTCGPIVHDILDNLFQMEKTGNKPKLSYLAPAVGNFNGVTDYVPTGLVPTTPEPPKASAAPATKTPATVATPSAVPDDSNDITAPDGSVTPPSESVDQPGHTKGSKR